jgi:hypothetical protein
MMALTSIMSSSNRWARSSGRHVVDRDEKEGPWQLHSMTPML